MKPHSVHAIGLLFLAACSSSTPSDAQQASTGRANAEPTAAPFTATPVATFEAPWAMDFLPGSSRALVTEKAGRLWLIDVNGGAKKSVAGVPAVVSDGQGGLLDVKVGPSFARDSGIYFTLAEASQNGGSQLALARGNLIEEPGGARLDKVQVIWRNPTGGKGGHFGARIAFAPDGKSIFLSAGERQRFMPAQDPNLPMGKILHLTLDGKPLAAGRPGASSVTVIDPPTDSEVAKQATGRTVTWPGTNNTLAETWTSGHRNPLGLAFAPDGRLWEIEMGPKGGDELNLILKGRNYGYPRVSNGTNYNGVDIPDHKPGDGFEAPKAWWNPSISPADLLIYSGTMFPQWKGDALIPALSGQALIHVPLRGDQAGKAQQWDMGKRIRAVDQGPDGAVYLLEDEAGARLLKLTPNQMRR